MGQEFLDSNHKTYPYIIFNPTVFIYKVAGFIKYIGVRFVDLYLENPRWPRQILCPYPEQYYPLYSVVVALMKTI